MSLHSYYNSIFHKQQYRCRCPPYPFLSVPVEAADPAARICKHRLTLIVSRLTPKDARCCASAFEHKKQPGRAPLREAPTPSPSSYNAILRLVNDNLLQSVEQTTSDLNAVGVRRRHTLPGLLVVLIRLRLAFLTRLQEVTWFHNHLAT